MMGSPSAGIGRMPAHSASMPGSAHGWNDSRAPATIESMRRRSSRLLMPLNSIVPPMRMRSPYGVQPTCTSASRMACAGSTVGRTEKL